MTRFWWLNPWAEVRRLRGAVDLWRNDAGSLMTAWNKERGACLQMENENAELKRQIAEQSDAAQAALCRAMCEKDTVIQSWAQRYVALCSINAMLEQKNARLEGDTDYPHWSKI